VKKSFSTRFIAVVVVSLLAATLFAASLVDLNLASQKDLEALKGVGPATAKKIIAARPYASIDQLSKAGLSPKLVSSLRRFVTVSPAPAATAAPATTAKAKTTSSKGAPAAGSIDLNNASQKDLEGLKGVGPATARKIIAGRPYASVDQLSRAGLSKTLIDSLGPSVSVSSSATPMQSPPTTSPKTESVPAAPTSPAPPQTSSSPAGMSPQRVVSPAKVSGKLASGQTVNINTASKELLDALPGIGPVKAQAIIDGRPFAKIEDVMKVKGIKQGEFSKIKDLITVN
jgi:competence protein ComEA